MRVYKYTGNIKRLRCICDEKVMNLVIPAAIEAEAKLSLGVKMHCHNDKLAAHGKLVASNNATHWLQWSLLRAG